MVKLALLGSLLAVATSSVYGHGYVEEITANGVKYTGYLPYTDPYTTPTPQRIVRKVPGNGPVEDLSLIDVQCNGYAAGGVTTAPAPLVAKVAAGSQISLKWTAWPDSHKSTGTSRHLHGASASDITKWSPGTSAVWFKVAEAGKSADGKWAATDGLYATGSVYTFTIPKNLKPGQYIIRHELIALHAAFQYPGVQVYPSCIQVEVTGSGSALPTSFVSFPGAYTASTPGIVYDIVKQTGSYPIPGPAVWTGGN